MSNCITHALLIPLRFSWSRSVLFETPPLAGAGFEKEGKALNKSWSATHLGSTKERVVFSGLSISDNQRSTYFQERDCGKEKGNLEISSSRVDSLELYQMGLTLQSSAEVTFDSYNISF